MQSELLKPSELLREYFRSAELFGEDEFLTAPAVPVKKKPVPISESPEQDPEIRLKALYEKYAQCQMCPLSKSRKKIVFGTGSARPELLLVGEGPGFEEDRTGIVGPAGKLLDKILLTIGLSRQNVYILNLVKCRAMKEPDHPEKRGNDCAPTPSEVTACREILNAQIDILNPPVICTLGSPATKAMLGSDDGITKMRGRVFDFQFPSGRRTVPLVPTFHPAAVLRNELLKKDVWHDMKIVRDIVLRSRSA